jgi:hypothetical protein
VQTFAEGDHIEGNSWDPPLLVVTTFSFKQQGPCVGRVHLLAFLPSFANEQLKSRSLECPTIFGWQWWQSLPLLPTIINAKEEKGREREGEEK